MISRAGRAALLDRKPFTEAFFDNDAAADAAILVSGVAAVTYVGQLALLGRLDAFSLVSLIQVVIGGVVSWLILGLATWFSASQLFSASGRPQTMIGLQGLAVFPLLLDVFGSEASYGRIVGGLGLLWYLVVLVTATREAADVTTRNAAVSVLIGLAIAAIVRLILGAPFALFGSLFS
jgi:hypothetical protein